jgi:hypothetical protein
MARFKLTNSDGVIRQDGLFISADASNRDYQEFLVWKNAGNVPDPFIGPTLTNRKDTVKEQVRVKRDAVIDGGVTFQNVLFQTRPDDRENISGAAQLAFMAVVQMQSNSINPVGNYRWHGGAQDFGWIALDNSVITMDAPTVIAFARAVAEFKSNCIFYARYLKDLVDQSANPETVSFASGWPTL